MSNRRKEIDEYFLNPVPQSASKMLDNEGLDLDDGDHMQSYFKKGGDARDLEPVESNRRTIMPEIEVTGKAYQAKKVARKDLKLKESSSEDEEDEGDSEEGEVEMSEEAEEESVESE